MGGKRGGGDYEHPVAGRWAGDRLAIIGDYADDADLPARYGVEDPPASTIFDLCVSPGHESDVPEEARFKDITPLVRDALKQLLGVDYVKPAYADNPETAWLDVVGG